MRHIPVLGLAGYAGAGKDTVMERLIVLGGQRFRRLSIADPLKLAMANLLDMSVEQVETMKRNPDAGVDILDGEATIRFLPMRVLLQRMGTEMGRKTFGQHFWLDIWEQQVERHQAQSAMLRIGPYTYVNTSVRFPNEAERIIAMGGEVWWVEGPQDAGADGHESEGRLSDGLIDEVIDNTVRSGIGVPAGVDITYVSKPVEPDYSHLDDQIAGLIH